MHVMRVLDLQFKKRLENIKPHRNILSTDAPRTFSGAMKQQPPQTLTIHSFLYGGTSIYNPVDRPQKVT